MQIARRTDFQPHFRTGSQIRRSRQFRTADFHFRPVFKPQGRKLREFYPVQCDFIKPAAVKIRRNIAQIGKIRRCAALKRQGPIILHIPAIQLKRLQAAEIQPRKSVAVHSGRQADFCPVAKNEPGQIFSVNSQYFHFARPGDIRLRVQMAFGYTNIAAFAKLRCHTRTKIHMIKAHVGAFRIIAVRCALFTGKTNRRRFCRFKTA